MDMPCPPRASSWSILYTLAFALGVAWGCGPRDDENPGEVLECTGTCTCDPDTRTCKCSGGTDCVVDGGEGIIFECDGNARCSLECGNECHVSCVGTTGCDAVMGDGSTGECPGTASCSFVCEGSCSVSCSGSARCTLDCPPEGDCEITDCGGQVSDCGDGLLACRTSCPE
jgi:hypothetical protein